MQTLQLLQYTFILLQDPPLILLNLLLQGAYERDDLFTERQLKRKKVIICDSLSGPYLTDYFQKCLTISNRGGFHF